MAYLPVWFAGTLGIYALNKAKTGGWRSGKGRDGVTLSRTIAVCSLGVLAACLAALRDPALAVAALLAVAVAFAYSMRIPPMRHPLRELPVVKTLVPATVAWGALFAFPLHHSDVAHPPAQSAAAGAWAFCILLFNVAWCDARDIPEDHSRNIHSLPGVLGTGKTRQLLRLLQGATAMAAIPPACAAPERLPVWSAATLPTLAWMESMIRALPSTPGAKRDELLAEGLLIAPVAATAFAFLP